MWIIYISGFLTWTVRLSSKKVSSIYTSHSRVEEWLFLAALPAISHNQWSHWPRALGSDKVQCDSQTPILLFDISVFIKHPKIEQESKQQHWSFGVRVIHWVLEHLNIHQGFLTCCLWTLPQTFIPLNISVCFNLYKLIGTRGYGATWKTEDKKSIYGKKKRDFSHSECICHMDQFISF